MKGGDSKNFAAKVLLLGEYTVIMDGQALTVPLKKFTGAFDFYDPETTPEELSHESNKSLRQFLTYLQSTEVQNQFKFELDVPGLEEDIKGGLYFHSNIPRGYGVGSSGALVAATFFHYTAYNTLVTDKDDPVTLQNVRQQLAAMESFFHGSSSGLDPLTSLLGKPLRADNQKKITELALPLFNDSFQGKVFLLDTGKTGNTRGLVDWFKEQVSAGQLNAELLKALNNQLVQALIQKNFYFFESFMSQLSKFQLSSMQPMIPENVRLLWHKGLDEGNYALKLCGSGGGGYMLGLTRDEKHVRKTFDQAGFPTTFLMI